MPCLLISKLSPFSTHTITITADCGDEEDEGVSRLPLKTTAQQKDLAAALHLTARVLPSRPSNPILAGILLEAKDGELWLRSTDLEMSVLVKIKAVVESEGRVVVPGHISADAVRYLPEGEVLLREDDQSLELCYRGGRTVLSTYDPTQFPTFPEIEEGQVIQLSVEDWQRVVKQVIVACARDEVQPLFNGVLWEFVNGKQLTLVATDTHRLALWKRTGTELGPAKDMRVIIPRGALELAARLAQGMSEGLALKVGKQQVIVQGEDFTLVSRLIEAKYPNYAGVIPSVVGTSVITARGPLVAALERAALLVKDEEKPRTNLIKLTLEEDGIVISAQGAVGSMVEPLEATVEGSAGEIFFNVRYLLDAIKVMDAEEVIIKLNPDLNASLIQGLGDESYTHLVLPIVVKGGPGVDA